MITLRLSAAVAPYLDAIRARRAAGWRWQDIRAALSLECSDAAIGQAVRRCRWQAAQLPLPEAKAAAVKPENAKTAPDSEGPTSQAQKKALPRVGGQSGDREMTAAEKAIADIPHI